MHLIYRKTCRACGSSALKKVIDLGEQCLQGSFIKPEKEIPPMRKLPTLLVRCDPTTDEKACGLLQLAHSVPPEILYSAYWYRSGINQTMRNHLKQITIEAEKMVQKNKATVLDIGCNDGTLLNSYPDQYEKFGIDPSDVARSVTGNIKIIQDLFPSEELQTVTQGKLFDIITCIAMFYDLEDPVSFTKNIKKHLAKDGLWIFEMSYMPEMLRQNSYDTICHEHLEYYSLAVLEYILKAAEMKILRVELNSINGGSIRCYATHLTNMKFKNLLYEQTLKTLRLQEFDLALDLDLPYLEFQNRILRHKKELLGLVKELKTAGKRIHVYGASTKGNTILQMCGLDHTLIEYAADRNPDKFGARTLGTNIPIINEEESRLMKPDYYLVLPWHFKEEFIQRERKLLEKGTAMIFPLPQIEIITADIFNT